ncbi:MAG: hypothetical protein JNM93_08330 [Bacteriovoracaceae bacterium]|nr:hypothetical protein [Bacteriovoracaceae bacterium]
MFQAPRGQSYTSISQILLNEKPQEILFSDERYGWIDQYNPQWLYENRKIAFELFTFHTQEKTITIDVKSYFERSGLGQVVLIPTVGLFTSNGQKLPLKNIYFYLEEASDLEKKHLHAKWQIKLEAGGSFYLLLGADDRQDLEMQSGMTSILSPVYYNFSEKIIGSNSGNYRLVLDVQ